jgi:hypothetical protein
MYCQCSFEVAPRWMISALERFPHSSVNISYCESRAVIGDAVVAMVMVIGIGCREKLWCGFGGISQGKWGLSFRRKWMVCACVAVRILIKVPREGARKQAASNHNVQAVLQVKFVGSTCPLIITGNAVHVSVTIKADISKHRVKGNRFTNERRLKLV